MYISQKRVMARLASISTLLLAGYLMVLAYLRSRLTETSFGPILMASIIYMVLIFIVWTRERNLFFEYIMNKQRIDEGNVEYILCPNCQSIQEKGITNCRACNEDWVLCAGCDIPFEQGTKVLVAPCCGQGFHYEHFEVPLRERGRCPYCASDLAITTTNW